MQDKPIFYMERPHHNDNGKDILELLEDEDDLIFLNLREDYDFYNQYSDSNSIYLTVEDAEKLANSLLAYVESKNAKK